MSKIVEKKLEFHSVANIFPMMTAVEFESLKRDISVNGQREPIWTYDGKIIDGRNRYNAVMALGKKPILREYKGEESELIDFVISLNLHRRHLTTSQKACLAVQIMPELEKRAKENLRKKMSSIRKGEKHEIEKFDSRKTASIIFSVSEKYISEARRLREYSEAIFKEVLAGHLTLQKAKLQVQSHEVSVKLPKLETEKSPEVLVLSRRDELKVKEIIEKLGVNEEKARAYIVEKIQSRKPRSSEKRHYPKVEFRVSESDKNELQRAAREQNKTVAELLRELLRINFRRS